MYHEWVNKRFINETQNENYRESYLVVQKVNDENRNYLLKMLMENCWAVQKTNIIY